MMLVSLIFFVTIPQQAGNSFFWANWITGRQAWASGLFHSCGDFDDTIDR
jgi:hypothetical protein